MRIDAINAYEASKQILRVIFTVDYNHSTYKPSRYGYTYVYYFPHSARFTFQAQQNKNAKGLIKRYLVIDSEDIINTTAHKFSFSQIVLGAIVSRKIMSYREFFEIVKNHFEWIE